MGKIVLVPKIIVKLYIPMNICPQYSPLYKEFETISVLLSRLEARAAIKIKLSVRTNFLEIINAFYGFKSITYSLSSKGMSMTGKADTNNRLWRNRFNPFQ